MGTEAQTMQPDTSQLTAVVVLRGKGGARISQQQCAPMRASRRAMASCTARQRALPILWCPIPISVSAPTPARCCVRADRKALTMSGKVINYQRVYAALNGYK